MLSSDGGLCFRNICLAPLLHSLHMQQVSLHYLKCLMDKNTFKPESVEDKIYSHSIALLLIFLSDDELTVIKHMHISLIVHHTGSEHATQGGILPFIESMENDLAEVWEGWEQGKEVGWACSYSLLVATFLPCVSHGV